MRCRPVLFALLLGCFPFTAGCNAARTVLVKGDGGVVAIPNNTNSWPWYHRDRATELIKNHCPNGYEIVSEQEVVTGQAAQTNTTTKTTPPPALVVGGVLAIPVGEPQHAVVESTSYSDVKEWYITYRRK